MSSTSYIATCFAPVNGSSFDFVSFRAIAYFLSVIAKGYFGYFSHTAMKLFSHSSYLRPLQSHISALFQPYCSHAAMSHFQPYGIVQHTSYLRLLQSHRYHTAIHPLEPCQPLEPFQPFTAVRPCDHATTIWIHTSAIPPITIHLSYRSYIEISVIPATKATRL